MRLRQNRAKLHQLFLLSSCFWERIPITYTFFRPILLEVISSRRTWAWPNSKASTLFLHSTNFCTSAQFRSELISTKAAWAHTGIAFPLQPLCLRSISIPAFSRQAPPWLSPVMGFDLQLPNKFRRPRAHQSMQCWLWVSLALRAQHWGMVYSLKGTIVPFTLQNSRYYAQLQQIKARDFPVVFPHLTAEFLI